MIARVIWAVVAVAGALVMCVALWLEDDISSDEFWCVMGLGVAMFTVGLLAV